MHAVQPAAPEPTPVEPGRVLLVEDDTNTAQALVSVLRSMGCEVAHAERLTEAKRLCRAQEFDLALLDIELPDGSGLDFVLHLRHTTTPCAALVLTGSRQNKHLREAMGLGVTEYLLKPIDAQSLASALARGFEQTQHMRQWLARQPGTAQDSGEPPTPAGLGKSPSDLVRRIAVEFDFTDREADALTLVAEGHRDGDIAKRLDISYSRVRQLLAKGFRKMGLRSRNDFIRFLCERSLE
jgi:DNA-binding NarL/FixJ family response regulator